VSAAAPDLLRQYASFHRTPGNRACHWVGIPLIMVALLGFLARLPLGIAVAGVPLTAAEGLVVGALLYYLRVDLVLALLMVPIIVPIDALGRWVPVWGLAASFVVGWTFQLVGHSVYEKKSPAFLGNLVHLLIGPLFLVAKAARRV